MVGLEKGGLDYQPILDQGQGHLYMQAPSYRPTHTDHRNCPQSRRRTPPANHIRANGLAFSVAPLRPNGAGLPSAVHSTAVSGAGLAGEGEGERDGVLPKLGRLGFQKTRAAMAKAALAPLTPTFG